MDACGDAGMITHRYSFEIPRFCKAGLGEVDSCSCFPFWLVRPAGGASPCKYLADGRYLSSEFSDGVSPPNDEALLFRQKDPKPFLPGHGPVEGSFVPGQSKMANNSPGSNRFATELGLARDSAAPKAGTLQGRYSRG